MSEEYLTDDEQLEAVKRFTREYAPVLIIGALLGAGGLFGFRYYQNYQNEQGLKAAAQFAQLNAAVQGNDAVKSRQAANELINDFPSSPYADQAKLVLARIDVDAAQDANAVAPLTEVMNNSKDTELRQIARLRLARVLIDQGKPDDAIKLLSEGNPGSFAGRYHEVHADALFAKNDMAGAVTEYKAALDAADAGGVDAAMVEMKLADLGVVEKQLDTPNMVKH
jgi:predicted negative regulator of RcsB-dependent stress response